MPEEKKPETHVASYKKKIVEKFVKLIKAYPMIGAVNLQNLPAPQLQTMRKHLRGKIELVAAKRRLIKKAIEQTKKEKPGIEKLEQYLKEVSALLFTKENPFKLYKIIQKSKSSAPAKPGQEAPFDIIIPAGPTPFAPGPIIGELGMLGIKTSVEGGKVAVVKDSVIVKEGETIKPKVAELLTRFGIKPMEIGLNLLAVYEAGTIYTRDILAIDEAAFIKQLQDAHAWAFNLAVEAGCYTKDITETIIQKAFSQAKSLAKQADIMCDIIAEELVGQAEIHALSLKTAAKIETESKEEQRGEEKAEKIKEDIKKKEEEIKEDIKKIEKEIKKEEEKPKPKTEKIEADVKEVEEDIKELEEKKEQLKKMQERASENPEEIARELSQGSQSKPAPEPVKIEEPKASSPAKIHAPKFEKQIRKQDVKEGEKIYEKLLKTGTLRTEEKKPEQKPRKAMTPSEIIEEYRKKKEKQ